MVKPIIKDVMFLGQKSEPAIANDEQIITDLQDILKAYRDGDVGMAANMIGYKKRIIIVSLETKQPVLSRYKIESRLLNPSQCV